MSLILQTTITGTKELREQIKAKNEAVNTELLDAVERGCVTIENEAKRVAPVEFGYLRDNITHEIEVSRDPVLEASAIILGKVGVRDIVGYAEVLELRGIKGTVKPRQHGKGVMRDASGNLPVAPNKKIPYLFPSYNKNLDKINKEIGEALVKGLNK